MRHPPYHIRPNKAIDRFLFIEALRRTERIVDLSAYTYYGFGGPYLEEFRVLYEFFPELRMVSLEKDGETLKRQRFHRPARTVALTRTVFRDYMLRKGALNGRSIVWLDYTDLKLQAFDDFQNVLGRVQSESVVKVTLRAQPRDYLKPEKQEGVRLEFGQFMVDSAATIPRSLGAFSGFIQGMLQVAAQKSLPASGGTVFQPLTSSYYSDGVGMYGLTGVVCSKDKQVEVRRAFRGWQFSRLNWGAPRCIDVPFLSTRERLHLQEHLPSKGSAVRKLQGALGYLIDFDRKTSAVKLRNYAEFHRYYPYLMKATP